jgi:hypothetical protein
MPRRMNAPSGAVGKSGATSTPSPAPTASDGEKMPPAYLGF